MAGRFIHTKESDGTGTDGTVFTTGSITFANNRLYLISIYAQRLSGGLPGAPTVTGGGLTWEQIGSGQQSGADAANKLFLFRAMEASGATAGAVTITFPQTQTACRWAVDEVSNVASAGSSDNGASCIVQVATSSASAATSSTPTLSAFSNTENGTFVVSAVSGNKGPSATAGASANVSILSSSNGNSTGVTTGCDLRNNTGPVLTWDGTDEVATIAVEIACQTGIGLRVQANTGTGSDSTSVAVGSNPAANRPMYLFVTHRTVSGGSALAAPSVAGCGLTWVNEEDIALGDMRGTIFRGQGASPTYGAITMTFGGTFGRVSVLSVDFEGVDTSGTNGSGSVVQSISTTADEAGDVTLTFSALGSASNGVIGFFGYDFNGDLSVDATTITVHGSSGGTPSLGAGMQFAINDTTLFGDGDSGQDYVALGIEVKAAVADTGFTGWGTPI